MYKKSITYTTFDGEKLTEDFYFNLTRSEIVEMQLSTDGGLGERIKKIVAAKNIPEIVAIFKKLILQAYGVKSDDGKRFMKSEDIRKAFEESAAYDVLFMELSTDAEKASEFVNNIIPEEARVEVNKKGPEKIESKQA